MSETARRMFRVALYAIDIALAAPVLAVVVGLGFLARFRSRRRPGALLHFSSGSSVEGVLRKFGSLDFLYDYDGHATDGVFSHNVLCWFPAPSRQRIEADGWTIIQCGWNRLRLTPLALFVVQAVWLVVRYRVCAIRAWDPYLPGMIGWFLSRLVRCPVCVSLHADYDWRFRLNGARGAPTLWGSRAAMKRLERFVLRRVDLVLPIRQHLAEQAVANGVDPRRVRVIPHGIDLDPFRQPLSTDPGVRLGLRRGAPTLSFVGRMSRENYVDDVLALARELALRGRDIVVVMAGEGSEWDRLRSAQANDPLLGRTLSFPGFLAHQDAMELRRRSAVNLCLMGGFSLIEACASGQPVVAYDVEWHAELVRNGETGMLLPEGNVTELVRAVEHLLDHPEEAARMGAAAQALAFRRHSLERTAAIKRAAYVDLLAAATRS
jgi:glycosyltransferase involved in cell wall biosynthesis